MENGGETVKKMIMSCLAATYFTRWLTESMFFVGIFWIGRLSMSRTKVEADRSNFIMTGHCDSTPSKS